MKPHGAAWSCMEPPRKLQILLEPHGDFLNEVWKCMELQGTIVCTSDTTGVAWRPFQLSLEMLEPLKPHGDHLNKV